MMKRLCYILVLVLLAPVFANEYVDVKTDSSYEYHDHEWYEVYFDKYTKNPAAVVWTITEEDVIIASQNSNRKSWSFVACKSAKSASRNYPKSGFDQGHMCPAEDEDQSTARSKNTFRACNICPQTKKLNRGVWQKYEKHERNLAQKHGVVTVICGPYYKDGAITVIGKDNVRVPDGFFKVYVYDSTVEAMLFDQSDDARETSLFEIQEITGIDIELK